MQAYSQPSFFLQAISKESNMIELVFMRIKQVYEKKVVRKSETFPSNFSALQLARSSSISVQADSQPCFFLQAVE